MRIKYIKVICIQILCLSFCHGQIDTQLLLQPVEIKASTFRVTSAIELDSITRPIFLSENVAALIIEQSPIFIKSYGSNSLSTLSIRGGNANQALLKWNGIPISNPMLGISDMSLTPLALFNDIDIQVGGHSVLDGNGAVTGIINLNNNLDDNNTQLINLNTSIGSFGKRFLSAGVNLRTAKIKSHTKIFRNSSSNDFEYTIAENLPKRKQIHAYFKSEGILQNLSWAVSNNSQLNIDFWHQNTFREIPATTTQNISQAVQIDLSNRMAVTYRHYREKLSLESKVAYIDEDNDYADPIILIDTKNRFKRWLHQSKLNYTFESDLNLSFNYQYINTKASTAFYEDQQNHDQLAITFSAAKNWGKLYSFFAARKEWQLNTSAAINPMLTSTLKISDAYSIGFKVSREYRFPTLNELFWVPGGNEALLPEQGWNQELNFTHHKTRKLKTNISLYHRKIDNWILWGLEEGSFIYTVTNLASVRSYGAEVKNELPFNLGPTTNKFTFSYAYTISENQTNIVSPRIREGDQLFYTPKHRLFLDWSMSSHLINLSINANYTSGTNGINDMLDDYGLLNAYLSKQIDYKGLSMESGLTIRNILEANYRVIERRPMPGINYSIFLNFKF